MIMATAEQQPIEQLSVPAVRARIAGFVITIQAILFLVHWFIYQTWTAFRGETDQSGFASLRIILILLSVTFVTASLIAFRRTNVLVRVFYRIAAVWLGFVNFFFLAACFCWFVYLGAFVFGFHAERPVLAAMIFGSAALAGLYGIINA